MKDTAQDTDRSGRTVRERDGIPVQLRRMVLGVLLGLGVFAIGSILKSTLHVTEPVVYFWFGVLSALGGVSIFTWVK
ncbi:hypothetical protein A8E62_12130 [Burkholderia cenocepacia]|uniref:Uncharacterized protein n=1 Tax=Burkholderia stabilis TaxID=95485 RepID=A0AAJ5T9H6_9BURK|nr:hypothetical protein A8E62_12130 [Burkholderia cenocepacia]ONU92826.1 hypothetical protein A8E63_08615 [Burkholderia cenocepacia]VBB17418.1 hypothetical protein BSTAB16_7634 [Burkholderia stabilis]